MILPRKFSVILLDCPNIILFGSDISGPVSQVQRLIMQWLQVATKYR